MVAKPAIPSVVTASCSFFLYGLLAWLSVQPITSVMLAPHIAEHFANLARSGPDVLQPISMMYVADDCEQAGSMAINGPDVHQPMSMMLATNDSNQVTEKTLGYCTRLVRSFCR